MLIFANWLVVAAFKATDILRWGNKTKNLALRRPRPNRIQSIESMKSDFAPEIRFNGDDIVILREVNHLARNLISNSRIEPHQRSFFHHVQLHGFIIP